MRPSALIARAIGAPAPAPLPQRDPEFFVGIVVVLGYVALAVLFITGAV